MADVFISYHRSEGTSALVRRIDAKLESMGISCWYDTKDPTPGRFDNIIQQEIKRCKVFLFIWDIGANQSDWCYDEVSWALERKKIPIPLQLGQFERRDGLLRRLRNFNIFYGGDSPDKANIEKVITKIADKKRDTKIKVAFLVFFLLLAFIMMYFQDTVISDTWTLKRGRLTVYGTENGEMETYSASNLYPWEKYREKITCVVISENVSKINKYAFLDCSRLKTLIIPGSVISIGAWAFSSCGSLESVIIPNSVTSIEQQAFSCCNSLKIVTIPDSVAFIEEQTFRSCNRLEIVTISDGVISIGIGAFAQCSSLESVTIPDSVISIGAGAFLDCKNLKSVSVPANAEIADNAFPKTTKIIRRE